MTRARRLAYLWVLLAALVLVEVGLLVLYVHGP